MSSPKVRALLKLLALIAIVGVSLWAFRYTPLAPFLTREKLLGAFQKIRDTVWGPPVFILVYGLACAVAFPGTLMTLLGGVLFGPWQGTLYNLLGACLGASLAFGLARLLGRDFVGLFVKNGKLAAFDEKVAQNGFRVIFTLRLAPVFPFTGINFGAGLSRIKFFDFLTASAVGMVPGTFIYTYFADALFHGISGAGRKALLNVALAGALLIGLSFLPALLKRFQK